MLSKKQDAANRNLCDLIVRRRFKGKGGVECLRPLFAICLQARGYTLSAEKVVLPVFQCHCRASRKRNCALPRGATMFGIKALHSFHAREAVGALSEGESGLKHSKGGRTQNPEAIISGRREVCSPPPLGGMRGVLSNYLVCSSIYLIASPTVEIFSA